MSNRSPNSAVTHIQKFQKLVIYIFHASLLLKTVAAFVPALNFPSGILLTIFFVLELFLLPPLGMAFMCIFASALFFILPFVVITLAEILIETMVLFWFGAILSYLLSGVLITIVNGFIISIQEFTVVAPMLLPSFAFYMLSGTAKVLGDSTKASVDSVGKAVVRKKGSAFISFLGSLLVLIVIGWPSLSYANAISGGYAFKPAVLLSQAHLNHLNIGASKECKEQFLWESKWTFENGFYDAYINNGSNNISQGEENLIAGNQETLAYVSNGVLYVQNPTITGNYRNAGYKTKATDALIIVGTDAYIFGYNKVFVCGKKGYYTWKKTNWTSKFEELSTEEQFEHVYDILERQNTTDTKKFSYDEVGAVAYAQRNGLLLEYDGETNQAYFADKAENGEITVYLQSAPNHREKVVSFTPTYDGPGIPYTMVGDEGILYLNGNQIVFIDKYSFDEIVTFEHPETNGETDKFMSLHYADLGDRGQYSIYIDEKDQIWIDTRLIGVHGFTRVDWKCDKIRITGFAGNYIYSMEYDNDWLSKLTYINDLDMKTEHSGWKFHEIWAESNDYQRIELKQSKFDEKLAEEEKKIEKQQLEAAQKAEEERLNDPYVRFPEPKLKARRGRELYDKTYIATASYSTYSGPQEQFSFKYPPALYDDVEYVVENDGSDIDIFFTCSEDQSSLDVSVHPLPDNVTDAKSYAKELCNSERDNLFHGKEIEFNENEEKGRYRFLVEGASNEIDGMQCHVICQVDDENIMKMIIRIPNSKNSEESVVKNFYVKKLHYHCGFGILDKAPVMK